MNKFTPYSTLVPNTGNPTGIEFDGTTESLIHLDCIQQYLAQPSVHLTVSCDCLYGIKHDGFTWELLGLIKDPTLIDLPKFPGWKFKVILANGDEAVLTDKDIKCIVGDVITLKDKTIAIKRI